MYLLDTNVAIALISGQPAAVRSRSDRARAAFATLAISTVSVFELWYGVFRSQQRAKNARILEAFLASSFQIITVEAEDAMTAAEIRAVLEAAGTPIGPYDLLIAAQALRRDATLVTANQAEFTRIPGLKCANWSTR